MKDEAYLAGEVYRALKHKAAIPTFFEDMPARPEELPCLSLQSLAGDPVVRGYKDGSFLGRYRFALYLRKQADDTSGRFNALEMLASIAAYIDGISLELAQPYHFYRIEQDTLPVKMSAQEQYDDWQTTHTMTFKKG